MAREVDEAFIEEAIERYQRIDALHSRFTEALPGVEVTVRSPDGLVEVLVAADGQIRDMRVAGSLAGRSADEVSRAMRAAVIAAADAASWARGKLHAEVFGEQRPLR